MSDDGTADTLASVPKSFSPANRRRLSAAGLRTFLAIADLWGLTEPQRRLVLGNPSISAYRRWVRRARADSILILNVDALAQISAVLGIHQALGILFKTEAEGIEWLRGPHKATVFGGQPPLSLIANGDKDSLLTVRRFLEAAQGGLYMAPNEIDANFEPYTDQQIVDVAPRLSTTPDEAPVGERPSFREGDQDE